MTEASRRLYAKTVAAGVAPDHGRAALSLDETLAALSRVFRASAGDGEERSTARRLRLPSPCLRAGRPLTPMRQARAYTPPEAPFRDAYLAVMAGLGAEPGGFGAAERLRHRQPGHARRHVRRRGGRRRQLSGRGRDRRRGPRTRLRPCTAAGVRGVRVEPPRSPGRAGGRRISAALAARIAPLGWHLQLLIVVSAGARPGAPSGRPAGPGGDRPPRPHARRPGTRAPRVPGAARPAARRRRSWVKLSAPYRHQRPRRPALRRRAAPWPKRSWRPSPGPGGLGLRLAAPGHLAAAAATRQPCSTPLFEWIAEPRPQTPGAGGQSGTALRLRLRRP